MNLSKAIATASNCFINVNDRGGKPYILHCLHVMHNVSHLGDTAMICAVLHDVVEDCEAQGVTFDFLRKEGFSEEVIVILQLLTHRKDTDYMQYIKALSVHPIAAAIKRADLEHNSQITRLKGLRAKDFDRLQKYAIAYEYLKEC
jgi:(p)ppGpp synthase/HD superfamily hydrolase